MLLQSSSDIITVQERTGKFIVVPLKCFPHLPSFSWLPCHLPAHIQATPLPRPLRKSVHPSLAGVLMWWCARTACFALWNRSCVSFCFVSAVSCSCLPVLTDVGLHLFTKPHLMLNLELSWKIEDEWKWRQQSPSQFNASVPLTSLCKHLKLI